MTIPQPMALASWTAAAMTPLFPKALHVCAHGRWRSRRIKPSQPKNPGYRPKSNRFKPKKWQRHRHHVGSYPPFPPHASRHTPSAYHCRLLPAIASLPATENSGFFPLQKPSNHWANPQKTPKKNIKKSCKYVRPTIHVSINPLIHPMLDAPRLSTLNSPNSQPFTLPPD